MLAMLNPGNAANVPDQLLKDAVSVGLTRSEGKIVAVLSKINVYRLLAIMFFRIRKSARSNWKPCVA